MPKKQQTKDDPIFGDRRIFPDFSRDRGHAAPEQKELFFVYRMGVFPPTHHPLTHFLRVLRISVVVSNRACSASPYAHQSHVCTRKRQMTFPQKNLISYNPTSVFSAGGAPSPSPSGPRRHRPPPPPSPQRGSSQPSFPLTLPKADTRVTATRPTAPMLDQYNKK